jgi:hypothetical protein
VLEARAVLLADMFASSARRPEPFITPSFLQSCGFGGGEWLVEYVGEWFACIRWSRPQRGRSTGTLRDRVCVDVQPRALSLRRVALGSSLEVFVAVLPGEVERVAAYPIRKRTAHAPAGVLDLDRVFVIHAALLG